MNDWKLILKVVGASVILVLIMIFGLTKMAGTTNSLQVDMKVLLDGAKLVKENGEVKVAVVNFSDMECPSCKRVHDETKDLQNRPGVKLVYRYFPLPPQIHKNALVSAKAVESARLLGKGWEMMEVVFDRQDEWFGKTDALQRLTSYAVGLGLEEKNFLETLNSSEVAKNVQVDADLAKALNLPGTPTVFINGEQVGGDFIMAKVEELLK